MPGEGSASTSLARPALSPIFQRCSVRAWMPATASRAPPARPARCRAPGSGGLPGVLACVEGRREFFDSTSKAAVSARSLSLRCSSLTRRRSCLASAALAALARRDRRSHPAATHPAPDTVLTAPGASAGCIHRRRGDYRLQPRRRRPAMADKIAYQMRWPRPPPANPPTSPR